MRRSPPLVKDKYFEEFDLILPYTGAAVSYKKKTYRGSVHNMTWVIDIALNTTVSRSTNDFSVKRLQICAKKVLGWLHIAKYQGNRFILGR